MRAIRRRRGMQYPVLVAYNFTSKRGAGFGRTTQFSSNRKVITESELKEMEDIISKENEFDSVAILSYQFMV